jgi:hypothetical protein
LITATSRFQVAIKGCGFDVQPIHADKIQHPSGSGFDKDQVPALVAPNNFRKVKLHETISPESHCPKWKKLSSASSTGIILLVVAFALATPSIKSVNPSAEKTTLNRLMHHAPPEHTRR